MAKSDEKKHPTPANYKVLKALEKRLKVPPHRPSAKEIADQAGITEEAAYYHLRVLRDDLGLVDWDEDARRSYRIVGSL
jgi:predicted transcriptional regulator